MDRRRACIGLACALILLAYYAWLVAAEGWRVGTLALGVLALRGAVLSLRALRRRP